VHVFLTDPKALEFGQTRFTQRVADRLVESGLHNADAQTFAVHFGVEDFDIQGRSLRL